MVAAGRGGGFTGGFTMVELVVAIGVLALLAALLVGTFGPGRAAARRVTCDTHVKALAIALDAFRQERGHYPRSLSELVKDKYISDPEILRCPDDPDGSSAGYNDFYVLRGARNDPRYAQLPVVGELPTIVCPFHEASGVGVQAFGGLQTHQFATRPAVVVSASGATVKRPGHEPQPAVAGMGLRGGDLIQTGGGGVALIQFFDGSRCELGASSSVSVLQSFLQNGDGSLYTLLKQRAGDVVYSVHHGSKFDVSTPTATAGALGTEFRIYLAGSPSSASYCEWWVNSSPNDTSQVMCATLGRATIIAPHRWVNVGANSLNGTVLTTDPDSNSNKGKGNDDESDKGDD